MESLEQVTGELRRIAADLLEDVTSYAEDMLSYILDRVPEAGADSELRGLTLGSCSSNLEAALSMVRHGIDVTAATAPATALEHARAMAARGYSVDVVPRFYRMGHAYFTERLVTDIDSLVADPAAARGVVSGLQAFAFAYIDRISSQVALEYVAELDRRANQARTARTDVVRALIAGDRVDLNRAERTLSHRLTGWQTGFVCWTDRDDVDLAPVGASVGAHLGSRSPLLVPDGARALWGWLATPQPPEHVELFHGYDNRQTPTELQLRQRHHPAPGPGAKAGARSRRHRPGIGVEGGHRRSVRVPGRCLRHLQGQAPARHGDDGQNFALSQAEVADGYVLTCQSHPTSPAVAVDYDA